MTARKLRAGYLVEAPGYKGRGVVAKRRGNRVLVLWSRSAFKRNDCLVVVRGNAAWFRDVSVHKARPRLDALVELMEMQQAHAEGN